jgi:hypothetical protein
MMTNDVPHGPLVDEAEYTLRMLGLALGDLATVRNRRAAKSAHAVLTMAEKRLSSALEAHASAATRELGEIIMAALGPQLTVAEVIGARRMLTLLLDALPNTRPFCGQPDPVVTLVTEWRERHLLEGAPGQSDEDSDVNAVRINEIVNLLARTVAISAEGVVGQVYVLREQAEDTDYLKDIPGLLAGLTDSIIAGITRVAARGAA